MNLLRNLPVLHKQALIVLLLLVPLAAVVAWEVHAQNAEIDTARMRIDGYVLNQPLEEINSGLADHMAAVAALLAGQEGAAADVDAAARHVDEALASALGYQPRHGTRFGLEEALGGLRDQWQALRTEASHLTPAESLSRHEALLATLVEANEQALERSLALQVPELETYYMADVAGNQIPATERAIGRLVAYTATATATHVATPEQLAQVRLQAKAVDDVASQLVDELKTAMAHGTHQGTLGTRIDRSANELQAAVAAIVAQLDARATAGGVIPLRGEALHGASRAVLDGIDALHDTVQPALVEIQEGAIAAASRARLVHLALVSLVALAAAGMAWLISRLVVDALGEAVHGFRRIASGDLETPVQATGHDEPNQVLAALDELRSRLQQMEAERSERVARELASAGENARIRAALDMAGSCLMLADAQGKVAYVNRSARALFTSHARELTAAMPGANLLQLEGAPLAGLLAGLGHGEGMLAALTSQLASDFEAGTRHLRVCINPVAGADGARAGTLVEWIDRTDEVVAERDVARVVDAARAGDLTQRVPTEGRNGFCLALAQTLNPLIDNVADVIRQIKLAAGEVERGTAEISAGNANLARRTESQSASLEQTSASMEQMTATVRQNAGNADQATQLARTARGHAERGGQVVEDAVQAMNAIDESSRRISAIIGVIDEIAFQTNLLALNAAVEAARAGEQGRGFAVVAGEVRNLAGRSASAAKEIKSLISASVERVEQGSQLVTQSGNALQEIVAAVQQVADVVAEIAVASGEQSAGIDQVGRAVGAMDEVTQQNAALVEEAAAAAQSMAERARALSSSVAHYRTEATAQERKRGPAARAALASVA